MLLLPSTPDDVAGTPAIAVRQLYSCRQASPASAISAGSDLQAVLSDEADRRFAVVNVQGSE